MASVLCWQLKPEIAIPFILSDIRVFRFSLGTSFCLIIFTYFRIEIQSKKCKQCVTHWQSEWSQSYWKIVITFTSGMTHGCQRPDIPFTCIHWNSAVIVCHIFALKTQKSEIDLLNNSKNIFPFFFFFTFQTEAHFLGPRIIKKGQRIIQEKRQRQAYFWFV